jgi:hypothetical protein
MRIRIIFETFTQLSVKTLQKDINNLEKQRTKHRESSRNHTIKKIELHNDMKRKINNLLGQIN